MKNKRFIFYPIVFAFFFAAFLAPRAFALETYNCVINHGGTDVTGASFTYGPTAQNCTFPKGGDSEPYQGISCTPEGSVLRKVGGNPSTCVTQQSIVDIANLGRDNFRKQFDGLTGSLSNCKDENYQDCGTNNPANGKPWCESVPANNCPTDTLNRPTECAPTGGCAASCVSGYVYCENDTSTNPPFHAGPDYSGAASCDLKATGVEFAANGEKTCAELGKTVQNFCTGKCNDCQGDTVASGRIVGECVTYKKRFEQIFEDGLTAIGGIPGGLWLGGILLDNAYAYGSLDDAPHNNDPSTPGFYGSIFVEVDQADHLNWSSASVPTPISSLIAGSDLLLCDDSNMCDLECDPATDSCQVCTAGICNNPDNGIGVSCDTSSDCQLRLACHPETGQCIDPNNPNNQLTPCTNAVDDTTCSSIGASYACVQGFCRNQSNGLGATCATDTAALGDGDADCAAGLICNLYNECVVNNLNPPPLSFMGITSTTFGEAGSFVTDANGTSYEKANAVCEAHPYPGSHVCTTSEMITLYNRGDIAYNISKTMCFDNENDCRGWINGGPPGYIAKANDCSAWTDKDSPNLGRYWDFKLHQGFLGVCKPGKAFAKGFACCK